MLARLGLGLRVGLARQSRSFFSLVAGRGGGTLWPSPANLATAPSPASSSWLARAGNPLSAASAVPKMLQNLIITRCMNRNARRPKKANHGKRPVSHARRREKTKSLKSRAYRKKIFGFW